MKFINSLPIFLILTHTSGSILSSAFIVQYFFVHSVIVIVLLRRNIKFVSFVLRCVRFLQIGVLLVFLF